MDTMGLAIVIAALLGITVLMIGSSLVRRRPITAQIAFLTGLYAFVMLFQSSLYSSSLMDPWDFLWGGCYSLVGPVLLIGSILILVRRKWTHSLNWHVGIVCAASILVVLVWSFGFWRIGKSLRPVFFSLVQTENERIAKKFLREKQAGQELGIDGIRYPFFPLNFAEATHADGVVSIMVSGGLDSRDYLIFDPDGKPLNESARHLVGSWYYERRMKY